jgi:hypothetical protein
MSMGPGRLPDGWVTLYALQVQDYHGKISGYAMGGEAFCHSTNGGVNNRYQGFGGYVCQPEPPNRNSESIKTQVQHFLGIQNREDALVILGSLPISSFEAGSVRLGESAALDIMANRAAAGGATTLYRAVGEQEAADILASGTYRIAGDSAKSGKYFYPTEEQARSFVDIGWASKVTSANFPREAIESADRVDLLWEGEGFVIPAEFFPHGPVSFP